MSQTTSATPTSSSLPSNNSNNIRTQISYSMLISELVSQLDRDRAIQLQTLFSKFRRNEINRGHFRRLMTNLVGYEMVRQALGKITWKVNRERQRQMLVESRNQPSSNALNQERELSVVQPQGLDMEHLNRVQIFSAICDYHLHLFSDQTLITSITSFTPQTEVLQTRQGPLHRDMFLTQLAQTTQHVTWTNVYQYQTPYSRNTQYQYANTWQSSISEEQGSSFVPLQEPVAHQQHLTSQFQAHVNSLQAINSSFMGSHSGIMPQVPSTTTILEPYRYTNPFPQVFSIGQNQPYNVLGTSSSMTRMSRGTNQQPQQEAAPMENAQAQGVQTSQARSQQLQTQFQHDWRVQVSGADGQTTFIPLASVADSQVEELPVPDTLSSMELAARYTDAVRMIASLKNVVLQQNRENLILSKRTELVDGVDAHDIFSDPGFNMD